MTRRAVAALFLAALLGRPAAAAAQFFPFGANKVQYRDLDWQVARGPHVDLYYYPGEAGLVPMSLAAAEAGYDTLALRFGHEVPTRIPLILYASHRDFEQTNVLPFRPPEGILGATDFLKRRVVLPYRGNLSEFLGTLRHELVHVFQLSISGESYHKGARSVAARQLRYSFITNARWLRTGERHRIPASPRPAEAPLMRVACPGCSIARSPAGQTGSSAR